jgi:cytidylate kinase
MKPISIIAIDGPAASGKSTLALRLAQALGFLYFDTGLMYRAVTWLALNQQVDIQDEATVTRLAQEVPIEVSASSIDDGRACDVAVNGQDITWEIRKPEVESNVSTVSAYPGVRQALTQQQRRIGLRGKVVMVGRDIGTIVLPDADLKIYLDASAEERARRRYQEICNNPITTRSVGLGRGAQANYEDILAKVIERDRIDSTREVAPLKAAEDAILLDSDKLDADTVFEQAYQIATQPQA